MNVTAEFCRNYIRECLNKCPYFSIIACQTSEGRLVLSVCTRLFDFRSDWSNPCKREFLLALYDLCSKGEAILKEIRETLLKHKINIADPIGQTYDTKALVTSGKKDVQAEIIRFAPNADYEGCFLHSLNLVIGHACN